MNATPRHEQRAAPDEYRTFRPAPHIDIVGFSNAEWAAWERRNEDNRYRQRNNDARAKRALIAILVFGVALPVVTALAIWLLA